MGRADPVGSRPGREEKELVEIGITDPGFQLPLEQQDFPPLVAATCSTVTAAGASQHPASGLCSSQAVSHPVQSGHSSQQGHSSHGHCSQHSHPCGHGPQQSSMVDAPGEVSRPTPAMAAAERARREDIPIKARRFIFIAPYWRLMHVVRRRRARVNRAHHMRPTSCRIRHRMKTE